MNKKGFIQIGVLIVLIILAAAGGYFLIRHGTPASSPTPIPSGSSAPSPFPISLGTSFMLGKNQTAFLPSSGLEITITEFYNSPCPKGVQCIWSGVGIGMEYRLNGHIERGINLLQAFGYTTKILKTDYTSYATLIVEKQ